MGRHKFKTRCWIRQKIPENLSTSDVRWVVKSSLEITSFLVKQQILSRILWIQIDMSKCMVAFIDWYHDNIDGERTKVKVSISFHLVFCGHLSMSAGLFRVPEWETPTPMKYHGSLSMMRGSTLVWSAMVSMIYVAWPVPTQFSPAISFYKMWKCFQFLERLKLQRIFKLILVA